jgi:hypothetical protein
MILALVLFLFLLGLGVALTRRQRTINAELARRGGDDVRMVDPREQLFSLPTMHDDIPPVDTAASFAQEPHAALMHEDDWRQDEFLPVASRGFVMETLSRLQSHRAIHAAGMGFREVFIRSEGPISLETSKIRLEDLRAVLGDTPPTPLYLQSSSSRPARVRDGFTFPLPDIGYVYGRAESGQVTALGLALVGSGLGDVSLLAALTNRFQVLFVDWVGGVVVERGDESGFRAWITRVGSSS